MPDKPLCIKKNVGPIDQSVRLTLGSALVVLPALYHWPPWAIAVLATIGGAQILESIIAY
ncbi:hypothetical protein SPSYN_02212 [Sporotomaculum syntrophicum]|uniref:Inner membrane protein YgaP-like transmembrane domain-containing protein n=1 Tax=Sporotomaculum syntrophicum TaxID=182264 RepID=A0A9D2WN23_9FIRM|nr:DUF2892 domain-containing protein [Sporotomaculum syntrophicum]KAF1084435.1 hypothetical protein SPSYN_02212 [Sporotomaculum syntrophicum]